jgi:hypothetical protein|tara:strand:+ start:7585 stop:7827 length:243 start_codon:yes stop_codon:yes gene_type:complete
VGLRIELLVLPFAQVVTATEAVTDTQKDIFVAKLKEVGAGHVFVKGNAGDTMCEQISHILPFATEVGDFTIPGCSPPKMA